MRYPIFVIEYETATIDYPLAAVAEECGLKAKVLLKSHILGAIDYSNLENDIDAESFKINKVTNSGMTSNKKGVILPLEGEYGKSRKF